MDALDVNILRTLGAKPFVAERGRPHGLKPAEVARVLGRSPQSVKDRLGSLESRGIIAGYRLLPNFRHFGLRLGSFHLLGDTLPDQDKLSRIDAVEGLVGVLWFYGGDLCVDLAYATDAQRARRLRVLQDLLGAERGPLPLYERPLPAVARPLTRLDWRLLRALMRDARRPLPDVAEDVGVTTKTVRARLSAMRAEGSFDEYVELDYARMTGLIPFNLAAWLAPGAADASGRLLRLLDDRCLLRFPSGEGGAPAFLAQVFASSPAEIQDILRDARAVEGVERVASLLPTGGCYNDAWLAELVDARAEERPPLPKSTPLAAKREILI